MDKVDVVDPDQLWPTASTQSTRSTIVHYRAMAYGARNRPL